MCIIFFCILCVLISYSIQYLIKYSTLYNMYTLRRHLGDRVSSCHKLMRFFLRFTAFFLMTMAKKWNIILSIDFVTQTMMFRKDTPHTCIATKSLKLYNRQRNMTKVLIFIYELFIHA